MIKRGWTVGRIAGWVMVIGGFALHLRVYQVDAGYFGHQVAFCFWWSGGWILFWSWVLWTRRRRRAEISQSPDRGVGYPTPR